MNQEISNPIVPGLKPGDKLGYFEVRQQIATGGMSLVWLGYDKLLNRNVAIKQIASTMNVDETFRERFRKEAAIQKKLAGSHPALVDIYDFIDDQRGLFIVMEFVDGPSLDTVLDQVDGALPPKQVLAIIAQAAAALSVIHKKSVIHRDMKPANILLPKSGGVKVADFGLATIQEEQDALTMGTARYMAPELFSEEPVDARADLYALGFIAYEMLAGRKGFENAFRMVMRDQRQQAMRWMKWHTNEKVTAPALQTVNKDVPEELADLVDRLIDKDPTQRIATADDLLEVIRRNFDASGQPIRQKLPAVQQPTTVNIAVSDNPTAPLPSKSKVVPILLGFFVLLIAGFGYFAYDKYVAQPNKIEQAAVQKLFTRFDTATEDFDKAMADWKAHVAESDADDAMALRASALNGFKQAQAEYNRLSKERPGHEKLDKLGQARNTLMFAYEAIAKGDDAFAADRYAAASSAFDEADDYFHDADNTGKVDRNVVQSQRREVQKRGAITKKILEIESLINKGDYIQAEQAQMKVQREYENILRDVELEKLTALGVIRQAKSTQSEIDLVVANANRLIAGDKFDDAQEMLEDVIAEKRYGKDPAIIRLLENVQRDISYQEAIKKAQTATRNGRWENAIDSYKSAMTIRPAEAQNLRKYLPMLEAELLYDEARAAERRNQMTRAKDLYIESYDTFKLDKVGSKLKEFEVEAGKKDMLSRAQRYLRERKFPQARELYEKISAQFPEVDVTDPINKINFEEAWRDANNLEKAGKFMEAIGKLREAQRYNPSRNDIDVRIIALNEKIKFRDTIQAGDDHLSKGNFSSAIPAYRKAIQQAKDIGWDDYVRIAKERLVEAEYRNLMSIADNFRSQGRLEASLAIFMQAQQARDTPEVREKITEVKGLIAAQ